MTMPPTSLTRRDRARYRGGLLAQETAPAPAVFLPQGEGPRISAGGMPALVKVHPDDCGGALLVTEQVIEPGRLVRAHVHDQVTQWSLVLAGSLTFLVGDQTYVVEAGGIIVRPAGLVHAVWNHGGEPARQVEGHLPGDLQHMFYSRFTELADAGGAGPEEAAALAAAYGTHFDDELTAMLEHDHQVSAARPAP